MKQIAHQIYHWTIPHEGNDHRPHAIRHKPLVIYSGLLIAAKLFVVALLFFTYPTPAEFSTITTNRIIELTNQERQELGLPALKHNSTLDLAAQKKAAHMLANNYFAHTAPDGTKPWYWFKQVNYNYTFAGENLAMNFVDAEDAVAAWINSPTHRDNIVSENYVDIGVAVVIGQINGQETTIVVQLFGKTYAAIAGEYFTPTSAPIEAEQVAGPINVIEKAAQQEVKLEQQPQSSIVAKILKYANKFFFILLGFIILNLILTIIIRFEIQHKPIIFHCFGVILLALTMILVNAHFIEKLGHVVNII